MPGFGNTAELYCWGWTAWRLVLTEDFRQPGVSETNIQHWHPGSRVWVCGSSVTQDQQECLVPHTMCGSHLV